MAEQFLNSMYRHARRGYDDVTRKYVTLSPDTLIYTVKNTETLESSLRIVENPKVDFYIANKVQPFHKFSMPKSEVRRITVPYQDREKEIATILGTLDSFYNSKRNGSSWEYNKNTLKNPNLYFADVNIEDFYKLNYVLKNGEDAYASSYKMAFSDIEVDISEYNEDFPEPKVAPCKIYLITTIYAETKEVYSFILYDERVKDDIYSIINDPDSFIRDFIDNDIKNENYKFYFNLYEHELDLIKDYYRIVHQKKPDFMAWWNMPFDIPTIINRLKRLGLNDKEIANILCHPEVPEKYRYFSYQEDPKRKMYESGGSGDDEEEEEDDTKKSKNSTNKPHPSRLIDWLSAPDYTQHYDQLSMFSCLRKRELYKSYKLDDIGEQFANQKKLDLKQLGYSIKDVNVKNFKVCLAYNIRDTYVQACIEKKQRDMNQYVISTSNTRLSKGHSMSITIKNEIMLYLMTKEDSIMGNAITYDIYESLPGAIVGRPELIEQLGVSVSNKKCNVFEDVIDLDASSLYPSLIITFNIFKSALFGRVTDIIVPNKFTRSGQPYSLGKGEGLFGALQTIDQSIFSICKDYMGLPTPEEFIKSINDEAENRITKVG